MTSPVANTYREYGVNYYPKLVSAIPFTPVTGPRLMLKPDIKPAQVLPLICKKIAQHLNEFDMSSMHWLFVDKQLSDELLHSNQLCRHSVQFQWFNRSYLDFEHYLSYFNSRKRKSIKKERSKIAADGVDIVRVFGDDLSEQSMQFFYRCYKETYNKRSGHDGYLTAEFFNQIYRTMRQNIMLVIAHKDDRMIASALYIYDDSQLCGRYWGTLEECNNLHFEVCYYQGIEFCIEQNIPQFNPGTQGEHKILRGFEPIYCYSNHFLSKKAFHDGVGRFIEQEKSLLEKYKTDAEQLLPFKQQ
ncbi:GNAT family N-acetyltransferase [Paraglaciecola aquimarina]|uniref:GNAT family N-acetyltransferase n=1 Tax=Paraglaciecola aquimarina TaxID=1235557 RepID=A0ABU3T085_9ALTE|nr:GNAT family N-acetyltransferase [Paraglaciecola aquimarina]MDU0355656.1 GNAT family N-acetyltransferase [Paraglaciecola aquimarina]